MGGYAIKTDHIKVPDRFLPEAENRQFFLNLVDLHDWNNNFDEGKKKFANLLVDELPELCEDDIWAKSKADGTAKTLTCIQALWFIAQCITRLTMHTPISLLELNTFGHTHLAKQGFLCTRERDLVEISDEGFLPDEPTTQPFVLHPGDPIPGTGWTLKEQLSSNGERIYNIELSHQDIKRWQMAWEFGQITQWSFGRFRFHQPATVKGFTEAFTTDPVRERVGLCIETCLEEEIDVLA
ncbi:MAG: hypothetical protein M1831_006972 [Alyxoria varia]|nr:MAG: hypothetical protein M1831_006972 [Alyxoria varia]